MDKLYWTPQTAPEIDCATCAGRDDCAGVCPPAMLDRKDCYKTAPKEPDRMTDERKAEIKNKAESFRALVKSGGALNEESKMIVDMDTEIDALTSDKKYWYEKSILLEQKVEDLEAKLKEAKSRKTATPVTQRFNDCVHRYKKGELGCVNKKVEPKGYKVRHCSAFTYEGPNEEEYEVWTMSKCKFYKKDKKYKPKRR